jgi:hypothetical protein
MTLATILQFLCLRRDAGKHLELVEREEDSRRKRHSTSPSWLACAEIRE